MEVSTYRKVHWPIINFIYRLVFTFRNIWNYFFYKESEEDLEKQFKNALAVLEDSESETELEELDLVVHSNTSLQCTGIITTLDIEYGLIDKRFYFKISALVCKEVKIGDRVSFTVYKLSEGEKEIVKNIIKLENDFWEENHATTNEGKITVENETQILKRNIISQVVHREKRILTVDPHKLTFSLDEIESEFVPIVGDWIVFEALTEVDEMVADLTGNILSILRVTPLRSKPKTGKIKFWFPQSNEGTIGNNTFFRKDDCVPGYVPTVGDDVVAEVIESTQGRCSWRAITVSPNMENTLCKPVNKQNDLAENDLCQNKHGIVIPTNLLFEMTKLNEKKRLKVPVNNTSTDWRRIVYCAFHSKRSSSQLTLLSHNCRDTNLALKPGETVVFEFECTSKFIGKTRELFVFTFKNFKIGRWFEMSIGEDLDEITSTTRSNRNSNVMRRITDNQKSNVLRGVGLIKPPAFVPIQLGMFTIPKKISDVVVSGCDNNLNQILSGLERVCPVLNSDLNFTTYNDRFHTLLYLEEIELEANLGRYDMERVVFIENGEYLMLEVPNLNERRPSIIIGDKLLAWDPWNVNLPKFEGYVHKIHAKHVYLKFNSSFHSSYVGQEYNVEFVLMRTCIRRCHQAIGLAIKNLGKDFLFASSVKEKPPQIPLSATKLDDLRWYNSKLNLHQKRAVLNVLKGVARPMPYIIFGPPGTGKTVTLVEAALQILTNVPGSRLLLATPSNSSADLLATRLLESKILKPGDLVRVVAYRRVVEGLVPDHLIPYCATADLAREGTRRPQEQNVEGIRVGCAMSVLGRHRITVGTCICLGQLYNMGFARGHFTHVFVDEAGQATEPEILIPFSFLDTETGQVVLAGDPLQLGPVVVSTIARHYGLEESFLVRITNRFPYERDWQGFSDSGGYDPRLITRLVINYRSLPEILELPSKLFYDSELQPNICPVNSLEARILKSISEELPSRDNGTPPAIVFHGVRGKNLQDNDSPSWYNPHEVVQVVYYINRLYNLKISAEDIGIITPYTKQVMEIRKLLQEQDSDVPKVASIEEFQGQERNIIILSTVRSISSLVSTDVRFALGFITSPRRLNVALTRAQALLIIVGNPHVLALDPYWRSVLEYCIKINAYMGCDLPSDYFNMDEV